MLLHWWAPPPPHSVWLLPRQMLTRKAALLPLLTITPHHVPTVQKTATKHFFKTLTHCLSFYQKHLILWFSNWHLITTYYNGLLPNQSIIFCILIGWESKYIYFPGKYVHKCVCQNNWWNTHFFFLVITLILKSFLHMTISFNLSFAWQWGQSMRMTEI